MDSRIGCSHGEVQRAISGHVDQGLRERGHRDPADRRHRLGVQGPKPDHQVGLPGRVVGADRLGADIAAFEKGNGKSVDDERAPMGEHCVTRQCADEGTDEDPQVLNPFAHPGRLNGQIGRCGPRDRGDEAVLGTRTHACDDIVTASQSAQTAPHCGTDPVEVPPGTVEVGSHQTREHNRKDGRDCLASQGRRAHLWTTLHLCIDPCGQACRRSRLGLSSC